MKLKFIALMCLLVMALGATACTLSSDEEASKNSEQPELTGKVIENVDDLNAPNKKEVEMVIAGSENTYENMIDIEDGDSVYDVLVKFSNQNKLGLITKDYDFGKSIDGIGDDLAGENNKYWLYYLNGEMAMQSVDNQEVNNGDIIEFKFEESTM